MTTAIPPYDPTMSVCCPRIRTEKVDDLLASSGVMSVHQVPDDFPESEMQRRVVDSMKSGKVWIKAQRSLANYALLRYPICFMDFETIFPALPKFAGMRP